MMKIVGKVLKRYYSPENKEGLTPSAFLVLVTLAYECTGEFGFSQVSMRRMRALTRLGSKNTVIRALRELEAKGFIVPLKTEAKSYSPQLYLILPEKKEKNCTGESRQGVTLPMKKDQAKAEIPGTQNNLLKGIDELMEELGEI